MSIPMHHTYIPLTQGMLTTTYSTKLHLVVMSLQLVLLATPPANISCIGTENLVILIVEIKIITNMEDKL
jgi:hypothetical protein